MGNTNKGEYKNPESACQDLHDCLEQEEFIVKVDIEDAKNIKHMDKINKNSSYKLELDELKKLLSKKMVNKTCSTNSFYSIYEDLYNNDIPILITSDSILHAFNKLYTGYLQEIEQTEHIGMLRNICKSVINTIQSIEINMENTELSKMFETLELVFMIPYLILSLNYELSSSTSLDTKVNIPSKEQLLDLINNKKKGFDTNTYQYDTLIGQKKLASFGGHYGFDIEQCCNYIIDNDSVAEIYTNYIMPEIKENYATYKYTNENKLLTVLQMLSNYHVIDLSESGLMPMIITKPIGSTEHNYNYCIAFNWIANIRVLDPQLICILCKILEQNMNQINEYMMFLIKMYGVTNGCEQIGQINNILKMCACPSNNLSETINFIGLNKNKITEKMGTKSFAIIGNIYLPDACLIKSIAAIRKFPSVTDLTCTLFNDLPLDNTEYGKQMSQIKGINVNVTTIFGQLLNTIKALNQEEFYKEHNLEPFCNSVWTEKQHNTQTGFYVGMKHTMESFNKDMNKDMNKDRTGDNSKNVDRAPIEIEPCIKFWRELSKAVIMMKNLILDPENKFYNRFDKLEKLLEKLIKYSDMYINRKIKNLKDLDDLKDILKWYPSLFIDSSYKCYKPECISIYASQDVDTGGNIYVGTGEEQLQYIIINDTVYIGPIFTTYECVIRNTDNKITELTNEQWHRYIKNIKKNY